MFGLGITEIILILVAVVILFFGGKKLSELARGVGRFTGEYKKGKAEIEEEIKNLKQDDSSSTANTGNSANDNNVSGNSDINTKV